MGVVCCWGTCPTLFNICIPTFTIRSLQFHKAQRKTFFNLEKFFYFLEVRTCSNQRHVCMLSTCEGQLILRLSLSCCVVNEEGLRTGTHTGDRSLDIVMTNNNYAFLCANIALILLSYSKMAKYFVDACTTTLEAEHPRRLFI